MPGRQAPIAHQGRKDRGSRAHLDNSLRQGAHAAIDPPRDLDSDIWQALEGKDVKDLLLNVGSGGGAAPAAASGGAAGAAAGGADAPAEEEKEEGTLQSAERQNPNGETDMLHREGGVRRGHGLRSLRLSAFFRFFFHICLSRGVPKGPAAYHHCGGGKFTTYEVIRHAYGSSRRIQ
jgi:ribosomal protein L12E/L44/L45/RPP1/RPP2